MLRNQPGKPAEGIEDKQRDAGRQENERQEGTRQANVQGQPSRES